MLLRQVDRRTGLTQQIANKLDDGRVQGRCDHSQLSLLRQQVYALALGDEDLNDHQTLRHDLALQTAIDRDRPLASAATLCRWESTATRNAAWSIHEVIVDQFIASLAFYTMDRGYLDFARLYSLCRPITFFVIRGKSNLQCRRLYSHPVDKSTVAVYVLVVAIIKKRLHLDASLYRILQILSVTVFEKMPLNQLLAGGGYRMKQIESPNQLILFD